MWFNPDDLLFTEITLSANSEIQISKLARLAAPLPMKTIDSSLEISKLAELAAPFDSEINIDDHQKIINWLVLIGETDPEIIAETLDRCGSDLETLAYFLHRADEGLINQQPEPQSTTCRNCQSFKSHNSHGGGSGRCLIGVQLSGVCSWADTVHLCDKYQENIKAA
jgi:hypothetical protein